MVKIPIKIKKSRSLVKKVSDELKVDLRENNESRPRRALGHNLFKKSLGWIVLVLIGAILTYSANWFLNPSKKAPLTDIIPQEAIAFGLIDQESFYSQILPFEQSIQGQSSFYKWLSAKIEEKLNQNSLDFQKDIQPLFRKQLGIALFPPESEEPFPFIIILQKQAASVQINRILSQIEPELKKDFHLFHQIYRQVKIIILKPLSPSASNYYYSQIENYLVISNSTNWLEKTIDLIIQQ